MIKPSELSCWKCSASLADVLLPLSRLAKCKSCNADLHVCRMCQFYDTTVSNACTEPVAEKVTDKQRKNFCGYFQPDVDAGNRVKATADVAALSQLDALFGLSGSSKDSSPVLTAEELARRKLDELFGLKPDDK